MIRSFGFHTGAIVLRHGLVVSRPSRTRLMSRNTSRCLCPLYVDCPVTCNSFFKNASFIHSHSLVRKRIPPPASCLRPETNSGSFNHERLLKNFRSAAFIFHVRRTCRTCLSIAHLPSLRVKSAFPALNFLLGTLSFTKCFIVFDPGNLKMF